MEKTTTTTKKKKNKSQRSLTWVQVCICMQVLEQIFQRQMAFDKGQTMTLTSGTYMSPWTHLADNM